jgi:hypothetical protein
MKIYSLWLGQRFVGIFKMEERLVACLRLDGYTVLNPANWGIDLV